MIRCTEAEVFLRGLSSGSVDAVISDPPYGTNEADRAKVIKRGRGVVEFAHAWDRELPLAWLAGAARALRPGGALAAFTDNKRVGDLWAAGEAEGLRGRQCFYWVKANPPPNPRQNFASAVESGVLFVKPGPDRVWNGGGWCRNFVESPTAHAEQDGYTRHHPTQKPIAVMRWLVEIITNPGDLVVDPFAGSGTTGVACLLTGRNFAGCEIDPGFAERARMRLESWRASNRDYTPPPARRESPQLSLVGLGA